METEELGDITYNTGIIPLTERKRLTDYLKGLGFYTAVALETAKKDPEKDDEVVFFTNKMKEIEEEFKKTSKKKKWRKLTKQNEDGKKNDLYFRESVVTLEQRIEDMREEGRTGNRGILVRIINTRITITDLENIKMSIAMHYINTLVPKLSMVSERGVIPFLDETAPEEQTLKKIDVG